MGLTDTDMKQILNLEQRWGTGQLQIIPMGDQYVSAATIGMFLILKNGIN